MDQQDQQVTLASANEARRRLTKAGLATPFVLATLASRNALAGSTPYSCTISGKLSGNTSQPGNPVSCTSLGWSCSQWVGSNWRIYRKGSCQKVGSQNFSKDRYNNSSPSIMGCLVSQVSGSGSRAKACYHRQQDKHGKWWVVPKGGNPNWKSGGTQTPCLEMTLLEVMSQAPGVPTWGFSNFDLAYAQEACTAMVNAAECAPNFPLSLQEVVDMYNATCEGGSYVLANGVLWSPHQVCDYWASLHV